MSNNPPKLFNPLVDKEEDEDTPTFSFYSNPLGSVAPRSAPPRPSHGGRGGNPSPQPGGNPGHAGRGPPGPHNQFHPGPRGPAGGGPYGGPHGPHGNLPNMGPGLRGPPGHHAPFLPGMPHPHQPPMMGHQTWQQQQMGGMPPHMLPPGGHAGPHLHPGSRGGRYGNPGRGHFPDAKVPRTGGAPHGSPHAGRGRGDGGRGRGGERHGGHGGFSDPDDMSRFYRPTMSLDPWEQLTGTQGGAGSRNGPHVGRALCLASPSPAPALPRQSTDGAPASSESKLEEATAPASEPPKRSKMLLPRPVNLQSEAKVATSEDTNVAKPSLADIMDQCTEAAMNEQ